MLCWDFNSSRCSDRWLVKAKPRSSKLRKSGEDRGDGDRPVVVFLSPSDVVPARALICQSVSGSGPFFGEGGAVMLIWFHSVPRVAVPQVKHSSCCGPCSC